MLFRKWLTAILFVGVFGTPGIALALCEDYKPQPKPQNAGRDIVGQDLDTIQQRGFIEFAVYEDFPPYSFLQDGKPSGIDIEVGRLIAADFNVEARFRMVSAAENVDADLRNHVWKGPIVGGRVSNVMLHVPYNTNLQCRNEQVVLTGQYFNETIAIAYSDAEYPDGGPVPAYFRFDTVAVENDSISDFYLSSFAGGQMQPNIRRFDTTELAMEALARGEVMAAMGAKTQLEHALKRDVSVHQPPLPGFAVGTWTLGVAVRHNYRPLAYSVDDTIRAAVADGRMEKIFARFGSTFSPPEW